MEPGQRDLEQMNCPTFDMWALTRRPGVLKLHGDILENHVRHCARPQKSVNNSPAGAGWLVILVARWSLCVF